MNTRLPSQAATQRSSTPSLSMCIASILFVNEAETGAETNAKLIGSKSVVAMTRNGAGSVFLSSK